MATELRHRRGTSAQIAAATPAQSEFIHNVETNRVHVGDGSTKGGHPLALMKDIPVVEEVQFNNLQVAKVASVLSGVQLIRILGYYTAGDGGGCLYKKVATEPTHTAKFKTADGAWWEYAENYVNVKAFGAKGDGVANDTASINAALVYAYKMAPLYRGARRVHIPAGVYLNDGLKYDPVEYIPVQIHGDGKASTFLQRRVPTATNPVFQIGNNPSTTYRGEIELADMTIDGNNKTGDGLVLYEVWYSILRNIRISNCKTGLVGAAAIYIDLYSADITWNVTGVDINTFPNASFAGTNPAVINFFGGIIWRNDLVGLKADWFNTINLYGTGLEKNGTSKVAAQGGIVTGTNVDRNGLSNGVSMFGGWVEDNIGLAQLNFGSGFNSVDRVRFWHPLNVSTYAIRFAAGKYSVSQCTITAGASSIIKEETGVSTGNKIALCTGFSYQIASSKTSLDEGASVTHAFITVGGSDMPNGSLVIKNNATYYEFSIIGGKLKLKQGSTEVGSWGT